MAYLIQRAAGRGLTLTQVQGEVLRIGRGTNQDLRSENPAVALEHALIERDTAGYLITDRGSITGTYVNGRPVETSRLSRGDVVEIGDVRIEVQIADPAKPLFLRIASAPVTVIFEEEAVVQSAVAKPGARFVKARKFDYVSAFRLHRPWLTKLSLTAILLIVALGGIGEVIRPKNQTAFMPGGLSSAHARARDAQGRAVADDCEACHTPWRSVSSSKCLDCHPQRPHGKLATNEPDCFSCHAEHRGAAKLAAIGDAVCTGCHANLAAHVRLPPGELASAAFANGRYDFAAIERIEGFGVRHPEFSYPADADTLRFNHKLHLAERGVFNDSGRREVLQCKTCHALVAARGTADPAPISFGNHCQRCHRLTFDARFPKAEVPHGGDPGIAYGFVVATYSGDRDIVGKPAAEVRRILSTRKRIDPDQRAFLNAEQVIKTKCVLCHQIQRSGERLAVTPPDIPVHWLTHAKFTHGRHESIACETCHRGVRQSVATSDVLLPARDRCTDCHGRGTRVAQAGSTCLTCHEYHLTPHRQIVNASLAQAAMGELGGEGRMLQGILLAVIVVLLLVVLVPVGIALFQRVRPERATAAPPPPQERPAMPPPQAPLPPPIAPEAPTDRVNRARTPPPPDLTPPSVQSTRVDIPDAPPSAEEGASGTQMVQWYGMLHCTSGALEGQRFVIEEDGLYIGRDPSLSNIVIGDNRVSKRHVRLLPRDGKVWAIDQGSTNGTFLREQRITEVQLERGDELVLGDHAATFVYQI